MLAFICSELFYLALDGAQLSVDTTGPRNIHCGGNESSATTKCAVFNASGLTT